MPRPRIYDRAILRWLSLHRVVTSVQVLERFFLARGKSDAYGNRVLQRMVRDGLIWTVPLDHGAGGATRRVLSLTRAGWGAIGKESRVERDRKMPYYMREFRIQFAEVLHVRETEGWRLATLQETRGLVRDWTLRPYRHRALNGTEAVLRARLEKQQIDRLPLRILVHKETGDLRWLLHVRPRYSPENSLAQMPIAGLWPRIDFELVCGDLSRLERTEKAVRRWAKRVRAQYSVHRVEHHRTRHIVRKLRDPVD